MTCSSISNNYDTEKVYVYSISDIPVGRTGLPPYKLTRSGTRMPLYSTRNTWHMDSTHAHELEARTGRLFQLL